MNDVIYDMDKKAIQKNVIIAILIYAAVLILFLIVGGSSVGEMLEINQEAFYNILSFDALILGSIGLGISIVISIGSVSNYTDCFRVRRGYSYRIRQESLINSAPSVAVIVSVVKMNALKQEISETSFSFVYFILFYAALFLCYLFFVQILVIWTGFIYQMVLMIAAAIVPVFLFTITLLPIGQHLIFIYYNRIWLVIIGAVILGVLSLFSMKALKRHLMQCDMMGY